MYWYVPGVQCLLGEASAGGISDKTAEIADKVITGCGVVASPENKESSHKVIGKEEIPSSLIPLRRFRIRVRTPLKLVNMIFIKKTRTHCIYVVQWSLYRNEIQKFGRCKVYFLKNFKVFRFILLVLVLFKHVMGHFDS